MKTKKLIILLIIFLLMVISWGLIYYNNLKNEDNLRKWHDLEIDQFTQYEPIKNYEIYENSVKNKNIGLEFVAPLGWKINPLEFKEIYEIKLTSPDFKSGINFPQEGCQIKVGAVYFTKINDKIIRPEIVKNKLNDDNLKDYQEIIKINEGLALKTTEYQNPEIGLIFSVEKPFNENGLYFFRAYFSKERDCTNDFNQFLNSILINNNI